MSAAPAAPKTGFKFMLNVKSGPDRGASYQLLPPRVTIGRGTDNNIALTDPRVSRHAAVMEFSMEQVVVTDVSKRNSMLVNGEQISKASIKNGDHIRLGDSEFVFVVEALALTPQGPRPLAQIQPQTQSPSSPTGLAQAPGQAQPFGFPPPAPPKSGASSGKQSGRLRFYIIIAVVFGLLFWLLSEEQNAANSSKGLRTVEDYENDIKSSEERLDALIKKRTFNTDEERTRYYEAQRHYHEGFRDYQKGQYARAMRSFETARAIDPSHEMAVRYYKLAERQRDEMIARLTLEGRQYKEKLMYSRCSAAFEKVLDAIPDRNDLKYKQAEALKRECDLLMENRFR